MKEETLIKNTGSGAFRLFHSLPHKVFNEEKKNIFGKPRLARSTTEELLIELYNAIKAPVKANDKNQGVHQSVSSVSQKR